jgi:hypothetical protein
MVQGVELGYNTSASAMQMANTIFGPGVTVVSASYTGDPDSSGIYTNGDSISPDATPGDTGVILSTGRVRDFTTANRWQSNTSSSTGTNTSGVNNDAGFNSIVGTNTYDAAYLDVNFIPDAATMTMQFTFSSEEYPEYVNSIYNDIVGVWVNGEYVPMEVGNGNASVTNVSHINNINLYNNNTGDQFNTEMDGFTVTMTLTMQVIPGIVNSIRIGIADASDSNYDSNLLIAGDSVQTHLVAMADEFSIDVGASRTVNVLQNDISTTGSTITITHINGVPVTAGSTVTLPTGQMVTLNADGTFTIVNDMDPESVTFTYQVVDTNGITDTAFVTINAIPCFVRGARILTPRGEVPVERLAVGDLVCTMDAGAQPIRWIGRRLVPARDRFAPVRIRKGAFGARRDLWVSPQHRMLISESWAELMFGEREVLVAAKDLVNDLSVRIEESDGMVDYIHLMFDSHQVIYAEGLATESFLPGPMTLDSFEAEVLEEICTLFPELDPVTGAGYGPAARLSLKGFEAAALMAAVPRAA